MMRGTDESMDGQSNVPHSSQRKNFLDDHAAALIVVVMVAAILVPISLIATWYPERASAEQLFPQQMDVTFQAGTITAIYETTFQIDGRTFSLTPDAIIQDDRGREIEVSAFVVSAEVKYHVKNEQNDKIDRIIVMLPR